jgi:hypothetical protein
MEMNTGAGELSPERQKRHHAAVTPDNHDVERGRRMQVGLSKLKSFDDVKQRTFMGSSCEAFMVGMRGNIDLFYFEQGGTEAFVKPLMDALFNDKEDVDEVVLRNNLRRATKIIAAVPRRRSVDVNEPQWKSAKGNEGSVYKKHYFVRYDPELSTLQEKKDNLQRALKVSIDDAMKLVCFHYHSECIVNIIILVFLDFV